MFYRLTDDIIFGEIRKAAAQNRLELQDDLIKEVEENGTYKGQRLSPLKAVKVINELRETKAKIMASHEKGGDKILKVISVLFILGGPVIARLIERLVFYE